MTPVAQGLPALLDAEALRAAAPRLLRALAAYDATHCLFDAGDGALLPTVGKGLRTLRVTRTSGLR